MEVGCYFSCMVYGNINGDFLLYLQSMKPRTGVFCISINEARETTDLEMPDLRNTFVIKVNIVRIEYF